MYNLKDINRQLEILGAFTGCKYKVTHETKEFLPYYLFKNETTGKEDKYLLDSMSKRDIYFFMLGIRYIMQPGYNNSFWEKPNSRIQVTGQITEEQHKELLKDISEWNEE